MSAYDTSPLACPYCSFPMEADFVDVGVGMVQCGPYHCDNCHASQIGPERYNDPKTGKYIGNRDDELGLSAEEKRTGYYQGRISQLANQHEGKHITHKQADALYRAQYFDLYGNPYNAKVIR